MNKKTWSMQMLLTRDHEKIRPTETESEGLEKKNNNPSKWTGKKKPK